MTTINRFGTAISRTTQSKPYKKLLEDSTISKGLKILDYGCGKGFDFKALKSEGYSIQGYDKFNPEFNTLQGSDFDLVLCNYVLNVIESSDERQEVLSDLKRLGKKAIVSVRADQKAIGKDWMPYADGWITTRNTFQKFYTKDEVLKEFGSVKILSATSSEIMFEI